MAIQIQLRKDSAADWTSNNPTLAQGEFGYETDTGKFKVGDGSTAWTSLDYYADALDYGYAFGDVSALGNLGATEAIDWSSASHFTGTLDSNVTITHTNETSGEKISLFLEYDGSAQRTITWSDVDYWLGGSAPSAPSATGEILVVTMQFISTSCYASAEIAS